MNHCKGKIAKLLRRLLPEWFSKDNACVGGFEICRTNQAE